jgi:hypothetical protein
MNKYKQFSKAHLSIKYNMCGRKKAFDNKKDAYQKGQESYECICCGKWHRASVRKFKGKMSGYSLCSTS